ncbi:MAG: hypothetical protein L0Y43_01380 [Methylococcaceae bacterium]|nr:hypothetical protein [Methylococcaceae bacterium]
MFSIKVLFIVGGLVLCALLFVGISNDTERHESVRKFRKRLKIEQAARRQENKQHQS